MPHPSYSIVGNVIFPAFGADRALVAMNAHDRELIADRQLPSPPTEDATVIVMDNNKIVYSGEGPPCDCV